MSDETQGKPLNWTPDGHQAESSQGETNPKTPEFVTKPEIQAMLTEVEQRIAREAQSLMDKKLSKSEKKAQERIAALMTAVKNGDVEMSPEQLAAAKQRIAVESITADEPASAAPQTEPQPAQVTQQSQQSDWQTAAYIAECLAAGLSEDNIVVQDDPEAEMIDSKAKTPREYFESVAKAAAAKAARLENREKEGAGARLPGAGLTARGQASAESLTEQYKQEMLANRGKGYSVGAAIKEKYRKMGVSVDEVPLTR